MVNHELFHQVERGTFEKKKPFPWINFKNFLTDHAFQQLCTNFPPLELFHFHQDIQRIYSQRPHNRYYLAYEKSNYGQKAVKKTDKRLHPSWVKFIGELEATSAYANFVKEMLGVTHFRTRFAWHIGIRGSEVSPHVDDPKKLGSHIFYFNSTKDWNDEWGGATLILNDKMTEAMNPDFSDFKDTQRTSITNNRSFFFKNVPHAWHGMKPLTCPDGYFRRIFTVIFEAEPLGFFENIKTRFYFRRRNSP